MKNLKTLLAVCMLTALTVACDALLEANSGVHYKLILETEEEEVLRDFAGKNADTLFETTMAKAKEISKKTNQDLLDAFVQASEQSGNSKLEIWFPLHRTDLPSDASQKDLVEWLRRDIRDVADMNLEIVKRRAQRFDDNKASVTMDPDNHQIMVEAEDVLDPVRFRNMLTAPGKLGFWRTESRAEAYPTLIAINELSKQMEPVDSSKLPVPDMFGLTPEQEMEQFIVLNPFLRLFDLNVGMDPSKCTVGYAKEEDTAKLNHFIRAGMRESLLGRRKLLWMANPEELFEDTEPLFVLVCIRTGFDDAPDLDGSSIVSARMDFEEQTTEPMVSMQMDEEGSEIWRRITHDEMHRQVAIVFDEVVLSAPTVTDEIKEGKSMITGRFTIERAQDLAAVLSAGALAAPVRVVSERVDAD